MEGFLHIKLKPWVSRIITRGIAIIPASIVAGVAGARGVGKLLVLSQVILSLQLSFAVVPLVQFTSSRKKMGSFVNGWVMMLIAGAITLLIAGLNGYLVISAIVNNSFGEG